jgi:hypothetical protein
MASEPRRDAGAAVSQFYSVKFLILLPARGAIAILTTNGFNAEDFKSSCRAQLCWPASPEQE